jgi:hypothetical protein
MPPPTTITTIRTTELNIFLTPEAGAPIATIATFNMYFRLIKKLHRCRL